MFEIQIVLILIAIACFIWAAKDNEKKQEAKAANEKIQKENYQEQQEQKDREYNRFINEMRDRCIKEFGENYGEVKFAEFMMKMREIELLEGNKQAQLQSSRMLGMMVMQNSIHNIEHTIHH